METVQSEIVLGDRNIFRNTIDPFSAMFDSIIQSLTSEKWLVKERGRQIQKTLENSIGEFHQNILGSMPGWENLGKGKIIDIVNAEQLLIAEVKNKYNTAKGNNRVSIYDDLDQSLSNNYIGFTGYYVEIIPARRKIKRYNKPFTPSDNKTKTRRPANERIRIIDGVSFYGLASKTSDALKLLYDVMPQVIADIIRQKHSTIECIDEKTIELFSSLFERAFG